MAAPQVHDRNADQAAYWNGEAGSRWVAGQDTLDTVMAPILEILLVRAKAAAGERVIDIGCGCGTSASALAHRVGPNGSVLGIDISAPMLARARERASAGLPLRFVLADATVHAFKSGWADLLFSRFGVMFFADPALSFRNLRTALRPGGRLVFACWREPASNPWMTLPLREAYRYVPRPQEVDAEAPGPFAFAREERVRRILEEAGFDAIGLEAVDLTLDLAMGRGLGAAVATAVGAGPVHRTLEGQPAEVAAKVESAIRSALSAFQQGETVRLGASVWVATALNEG